MGTPNAEIQPDSRAVDHPKLAIGDVSQPKSFTAEGWSQAHPDAPGRAPQNIQLAESKPPEHHGLKVRPNAVILSDGTVAAPPLTITESPKPAKSIGDVKSTGDVKPAGETKPKGDASPPDSPTSNPHKFNLEPVTDPKITSQVPGAMYIGVRGSIRAIENNRPVIQDGQKLWLSPEAARGLQKAQDILDAQGKGKQIQLTSLNAAGRLHDAQKAIQLAKPDQPHASPGRSNHEVGRALDIVNYGDKDVLAALRQAGFQQGDHGHPIAGDPVHFSFKGERAQSPATGHRTSHPGGFDHGQNQNRHRRHRR